MLFSRISRPQESCKSVAGAMLCCKEVLERKLRPNSALHFFMHGPPVDFVGGSPAASPITNERPLRQFDLSASRASSVSVAYREEAS